MIASYLEAVDNGEAPDRDKLLAAHLDLADELRDFLDNEVGLVAGVPRLRQDPFLDNLTVASDGPAASEAGSDARAPAGYTILGELGRGGLGVVYLARHLGLNRPDLSAQDELPLTVEAEAI